MLLCSPMRALCISAALVAVSIVAAGQATAGDLPATPNDAKAILAAAAPLYDFNSADLKPWHLKASYQLYDEDGKPTEQGTFEYWWASPSVHRETWTRPGATHSDWHTADKQRFYSATGAPLAYFEFKLRDTILSPLPNAEDLDPKNFRLDLEFRKFGDLPLQCVMVVPLMKEYGQTQDVPLGLFPTYCFNREVPALRFLSSFGTITAEFNKIAKTQHRLLAENITLAEGKKQLLTASVDQVDGITPTDPALVPPPNAINLKFNKVTVGASVAAGMILKKQVPVYPEDAKHARVSGTVVLRAIIGLDGGVHDLHVVSTPWPSLAASALSAVSHWQYRPYVLNGQPVEVQTTINVNYSLSH